MRSRIFQDGLNLRGSVTDLRADVSYNMMPTKKKWGFAVNSGDIAILPVLNTFSLRFGFKALEFCLAAKRLNLMTKHGVSQERNA